MLSFKRALLEYTTLPDGVPLTDLLHRDMPGSTEVQAAHVLIAQDGDVREISRLIREGAMAYAKHHGLSTSKALFATAEAGLFAFNEMFMPQPVLQ
jgi:hypothetical protein